MLTNARSTSGSASTSRARSLRKRSASSSAVSDTAFWPCRLVKRYVPRSGLTLARFPADVLQAAVQALEQIRQHRHELLALLGRALGLDAPHQVVERSQRRSPSLGLFPALEMQLLERSDPVVAQKAAEEIRHGM